MMSPKIKKVLNLGLKLAILVGAYLFIYFRIRSNDSLLASWQGLQENLSSTPMILSLTGIVLMMIVNWALEAMKWQYLVRKSEPIGFFTSLKAVLAGITVSTFTPNRIGEFFGRVFILKHTNPWKGAFMTIVGSISQLVVTIVLGCIAFVFFAFYYIPYSEYISDFLFYALSGVVLLLAGFVLLLYFNIRILEPVLKRFTLKRWENVRAQLNVFSEYRARELMVVLGYSMARYIVFSLQYYFLLRMFLVPIGFWDGMIIIACIFFFMAAVPTIALSELGVRGTLAVFFMGIFFSDNYILADAGTFGALSASTLIWIINLVVPAMIGGLFVLQLKFFKK